MDAREGALRDAAGGGWQPCPWCGREGFVLDLEFDGATGGLTLHSPGGRLLAKDEAEAVCAAVARFYEAHSDEELDEMRDGRERGIREARERRAAELEAHAVERDFYRRQGHVYVVADGRGLFKIGRTRDLKFRLSQMATSLPVGWELVVAIESDNTYKHETELHRKFRDKRVKGEWFRLEAGDVEWLKVHPGW